MHTFAVAAALLVLGRDVAPPSDSLTGLGFLKSGRVLIGTEWTGLNVFGPDGKMQSSLRPPGFGRLSALSDDTALALLTRGGDAEVVQTATGKVVCAFKADQYLVGPAHFSADGKRVLTNAPSTGQDRQFALWDAATCHELRRFKGHTGNPLSSLAFGPGEKTLLSSNRGAVLEWDAVTGELKRELGVSAPVVVALPGGKSLFIDGGKLDLSAADGSTKLASWKLPYTNVFGFAVLPGTSLVFIGGQSAAFLLDVAAKEKEPQPIDETLAQGHDFVGVSASPDGKHALLADQHGETMLFDVPRRSAIWWAKLPKTAKRHPAATDGTR
jgi:WD40 repeat protein